MRRNICLSLTPLFAVAVVASIGNLGCQSTSQGLQEDAARNTATVKSEAKELQKDAKDGAETAAEAVSDAADAAGEHAQAAGSTIEIKAALMADKRVDASRIDVDSDGAAKIVHLRGKVTTAAEVDIATQIARDKAPGWTISNELVVAPKEP